MYLEKLLCLEKEQKFKQHDKHVQVFCSSKIHVSLPGYSVLLIFNERANIMSV